MVDFPTIIAKKSTNRLQNAFRSKRPLLSEELAKPSEREEAKLSSDIGVCMVTTTRN
jgi:hypothetical protein